MTYEDYNWHEDENFDVIKEANERAREVISMLRLAIINTSFYDHANYVKFGMRGDPESAAFKKMFNMKRDFVEYLEKETRLVFADNEYYFSKRRRKIQDDMINELMQFISPYLRGNVPSHIVLKKVYHIVNKIMNRSEEVLEDGIMHKGKRLGKPANLFQSPVIDLKRERLY